jgi:hypothetical protein
MISSGPIKQEKLYQKIWNSSVLRKDQQKDMAKFHFEKTNILNIYLSNINTLLCYLVFNMDI